MDSENIYDLITKFMDYPGNKEETLLACLKIIYCNKYDDVNYLIDDFTLSEAKFKLLDKINYETE
jgi:hypothetical protein